MEHGKRDIDQACRLTVNDFTRQGWSSAGNSAFLCDILAALHIRV